MPEPLVAFRGRRVLITGHTGFKGSWLALLLAAAGAEVSGLALDPPTVPSLFELARVDNVMSHDFRGDIRDEDLITSLLERSDPDVVIHMAAQPLVRAAYAEPAVTFGVNVMGTTALLEAVRRRRRSAAVLVVTTDKVYAEDATSSGYREEDRLGGHEPYSASKAAAELVVDAYRRTYFPPERLSEHGVAIATARSGNVIGGGDWSADRLIPDFVRAAVAGNALPVRSPHAVRPWQHVLSALDGYVRLVSELLLPTAPTVCRAWNFGPDPTQCATVAEILEICAGRWPGSSWVVTGDRRGPRESTVLRLDAARARARLNWRDPWTTEDSVRRTVEWYRRWASGAGNMRQACLDDIQAWRSAVGTPIARVLPVGRVEVAPV